MPGVETKMKIVRAAVALFSVGGLVGVVNCGSDRAVDEVQLGRADAPSSALPDHLVDSARAQARISEIRTRSHSSFLLGPHEVSRFERSPAAEGHVRAVVAASVRPGVVRRANVLLPRRATGAVLLEDATSHVGVTFALDGARDSLLEVAEGIGLYADGYEGVADVVHRVVAEGIEDFIVFRARPRRAELSYVVDVSRTAGLRLVSNTLEFLDASGSPQLRVAPPYVLDAGGGRHEAVLAVSDCALDRNPAAPWGRRVTPPYATACHVHVSWPVDIAYPAIVDPAWTATGSMATARFYHSAAMLASGKVLVAGGFGGAYLTSAELYDPITGTFAATGSLSVARALHTASALASGAVLVAGGQDTTAYLSSAELYVPALGTFSATGALAQARELHTASVLASGKVVLIGGVGGPVLASAEVYDPATSTFATVGSMLAAREHHTASVLATGKVLVTGGTTGSEAFSSAELFDPVGQTFTATNAMITDRFDHQTTVLSSGKVLVTGGYNRSQFYLSSAELYDPATEMFAPTGAMATARQNHVATLLLPSGKVLVAGGYNGGATAELYDPLGGTFSTTGDMAVARAFGHSATRLGSGKVLIAGGSAGANSTPSAELYLVLGGGACNLPSDCTTGVCLEGVCCAGPCSGACSTCTAGTGACASVINAEDPDTCTGTSTCDAAGLCKLKTSQPCPGGAATCLSGLCADGYCCNTPCSGSCDSCALPSKHGTCSPAPYGDPGAAPACAAGVCDGVHADCASTCTSDTGCAASLYCAANGTCQVRKAQGTSCAAQDCKEASCRVCTTGSCVDGVCCDTSCTGTCQACSADLKQAGPDGVCGPAKEGSTPLRGTCPQDPASTCRRDGKCGGSGGCRLFYPGGSACGAVASCKDNIATAATTCDGNGTCTAGATTECGAYACGTASCQTACVSANDCAPGSSCDTASAKCIFGATCDGDHTATDANGTTHDCAPYKCESNGTCKPACRSVDDCVAPTQCDPTGTCVAPPSEDSGGCTVQRRSPSPLPAMPAALLGLAVTLGYIRRVRRGARSFRTGAMR
jgi:hypothetical protein